VFFKRQKWFQPNFPGDQMRDESVRESDLHFWRLRVMSELSFAASPKTLVMLFFCLCIFEAASA
jgi:hypothetical protein